ncbi:MAG: alanine racemase [Oscillospiraceae bacterium]|nr:alanine racemase [Oscillospiraceae bacterium]
MDFSHMTRAEIDLDALSRNISGIRALCPDKEIIAVVKANAYGHGDKLICAELLRLGITKFAVSSVLEAGRISDIVPDCDILIFGATPEEMLYESEKYIQTIVSLEYARRLSGFAVRSNKTIRCHVKINSGMTRSGIDTLDELHEIMSLPALKPEALFTHFASADSLEEGDVQFTKKQQEKLLSFAEHYNLKTHSQNSGGVLYHDDFKTDMVRVGIAMYGLRPNTSIKSPITLSPVMSFKTAVSQIREVETGIPVSYGRTYTTPQKQVLAVIPVGYADGYSRSHSNKGKVLVGGELAPICGRVCMDQSVIDITGIEGVRVGDEVCVYSDAHKETGIEYIADTLGTIPYEVTCAVSARVPRIAKAKNED